MHHYGMLDAKVVLCELRYTTSSSALRDAFGNVLTVWGWASAQAITWATLAAGLQT